MTTTPPTARLDANLETRLILGLTLLGALLRLWAPGRLGLGHFDEGIYALAGAWIGRPGGLDPTVIPYAPGGYPVLVGVAYLLMGVGDIAAILVSISSGTATIPVAGWLARKAFGPGAGVAASAMAAVSGPHVAFSRMALTDSLALLTWLTALAAGAWFLDRPGLRRAVVLGLAVGLAQNVKYSGFLAGLAVGLAALVPSRGEGWRRAGRAVGWGLMAAVVAGAAYWPWYAFVERNGGYAALMAHHRGYVGGWSAWPGHFRVQMAEQTALAGRVVGPVAWSAIGWGLAWLGAGLVRSRAGKTETRWAIGGLILVVIGLVPTAAWWVALARVPAWLRSGSGVFRVLGVAWVVQAVMTPFYHPYARLWLPLEALGWLAMAEVICEKGAGRAGASSRTRHTLPMAGAVVGALLFAVLAMPDARPWAGILGPSDGLRTACEQVGGRIDRARDAGRFSGAKVLARPPVVFYLAGMGVGPLLRVEDRANLLRKDGSGVWAIEDSGVNGARREESDSGLDGWKVESRAPAPLTIPARLDLDPASALRPESSDPRNARSELILFRPSP